MKLFNKFKKNNFEKKELILDIDGPGIVFYSPKTVSYIKQDYDFLSNDFMNPQDIAKHVMKGDVTGFNTGSPGKYIIKIRFGYPTSELLNKFDIVTRLGIIVKDNKINFVDLFWLSSWDTKVPDDQIINIDNGRYYITVLTKLPKSKRYGDNQTIYMYFEKTNHRFKLKYNGVPILFK